MPRLACREPTAAGQPARCGIALPIRIIVTSTQIQYSQKVMLNFNGLLWPHVSVATLVPSFPIPVPPPVWSAALKAEPA